MKKNVIRGAVAAALALAVFTAMALSMPAWAAETVVKIDNFTFNPARVTVEAGTTVTWENGDDIPHAIASTTRLFKSKALDTDDKFSFTFATAGSYPYFCALHPHMTGTIVVEANNGKS